MKNHIVKLKYKTIFIVNNNIFNMCEKLKNKILKLLPEQGDYNTKINNFLIGRRDNENKIENCFYKPMITFILQGNKNCIISNKTYTCNEGQFMIVGVDLPSGTFLTNVSKNRPLLAVSLIIDWNIVAELSNKIKIEKQHFCDCLSITNITDDLYDAFLRLVDMVEKNKQDDIITKLIIQEIYYMILTSPIGYKLIDLNTLGTNNNKISKAILTIKNNFNKKLNIEDIAKSVNMTATTFYRNFKSITGFSPLQYQKHLRLHEARNLMLINGINATSASYKVGYESVSQFNREYKKMFGNTPYKDNINK